MIFKIASFAGLICSLTIVYLFETAGALPGLLKIFHWPALVLTGIGPSMLVCFCSDYRSVKKAINLVLGSGPDKRRNLSEREALQMHELGSRFYQEGPKIFEEAEIKGVNKYLYKVIERLSIRMPLPDIREFLEAERNRHHQMNHQAINVTSMGVKLAPSVGMLGTILGMVQLLSHLQDPSNIGGHMSLALLTTFWGLFFSLAVWSPLQQKLEKISEVENNGYNQALQWLELLEKRKPASYFAEAAEIPIANEAAAGGARA